METVSNKVSANFVQRILRLKNNHQAIGPLRPARSSDAAVLQETSKNIANGVSSSRQLLLTTGFGLHRDLKTPVRLPALTVPGLTMMEKMHDVGMPVPNYLLYQATDFIAEANHLPIDEARECASNMESYLRQYIDTFHAKIADRVLFKFGCDYPETVRDTINDTVADIRSMTQEIDAIRDAMEQINGSETKHSNGSNQAHAYAAANVFYSGALEHYPFRDDIPSDTELVLPIGGNAEKPFFTITASYSDQISDRTVIPLLTPIGSRPTYFYYPQSGDPLSIAEYSEAMEKSCKDGPIRMDLDAMRADGALPEKIAAIYPTEQ